MSVGWLGWLDGCALCEQHEKESPESDGDGVFEDSEMKLYKNSVLVEAGQLERALAHLDAIERDVTDKLAWHEQKGGLLRLRLLHAACCMAGTGGFALDVRENYHPEVSGKLGAKELSSRDLSGAAV